MFICRFNDDRLGVIHDGHVVDVTSALASLPSYSYPLPSHDVLIANLSSLRPWLERACVNGLRYPLANVDLLSPVANPGKIMAAPVNYADHLSEARDTSEVNHGRRIDEIQKVRLFLKAGSSLQGAARGVQIAQPERRTDHELELVVIIGKTGRHVSRADAHEYIAGYSIGLDMTVRGTEERSMRKSIDTYSVVGPWLATPDEIRDPGNLDMSLQVNGDLRQKANTRDLLMDIGALVEFATSFYSVHPGDLLFTGTPAGVGPVKPGDTITATIAEIGTLNVQVS